MSTLKVSEKQPLVLEAFINSLGKGAVESRFDTLQLANKRMGKTAFALQRKLVDLLIKSDAVSSTHGAIGDVIAFVKERVHFISKNNSVSDPQIGFHNAIESWSNHLIQSRFIFKLDSAENSYFVAESGTYGILIYQIRNVGLIENIFQCDWDVQDPTNPDSWLSLLYGHGLLTVETLRMYLRGHIQTKFICSYERFEKVFYREVTRRLVGQIPDILKSALCFQAQGLGIAAHGQSRLNDIAETAMLNVYPKVKEHFPIKEIFDALHQMHRDEAPFMTEAAFFEQWENKDKFDRLDTILYGYKPDTLGYIIKLKDVNKYAFIEVTNGMHITLTTILDDSHHMYLNLPRWNIEDINFMEAVGGKLEFEGFVEHV